MKLIVGLGNPGKPYQNTRHNIGFMFVDELAKKLNTKFSLDKQLKSEIASIRYQDDKIIIIKPQTFMNLSGEAVLAVTKFYNIDVNDIIVVYDDLDLPQGKVRIRKNGSSGGQKGMKSIIELLDTDQIKRIRIGIGKNEMIDASDYVLGKISKEDYSTFDNTFQKALEMIEFMQTHTFEDFMGKYN